MLIPELQNAYRLRLAKRADDPYGLWEGLLKMDVGPK